MLSEIYLIRHGAADRDPVVPYESPPGPGLNDRGRYEAGQAANFLGACGIQRLFASPFRRTQETAERIGEQLGLLVVVRGLLTEAPRAESEADLRGRIRTFLDSLAGEPAGTVALVSHGSPILMLRAELCQEPVDLRPTPTGQPPIPTAGIWRAWRDGACWRAEPVFTPSESGWRQLNLIL